MKHIKHLEQNVEYSPDLLWELLNENPLSKDNDFYLFIGKDDFKEDKGGLYKKTLYIERMVRITPDQNSIQSMKGMELRARFQFDSKLYHIWITKDIRDEVEGKGSDEMDDIIVDLISKYKKENVADKHGKEVFNDVISRKDIYNL